MNRRVISVAFLVAFLLAGCSSFRGGEPDHRLEGMASWYGHEYAGRTTANGEIFDPMSFTAAHRTLPFGTIVRVLNQSNSRTVEVRINDRGPFIENRIIDLSYAAALEVEMVETGIAPVRIEVIRVGAGDREPPAPTVVTIPERETKIPANDPPPPEVEFPTPEETTPPIDDGVTVEIIEEPSPPPTPQPEPVVTTPPPPRQPSPTPAPGSSERGRFAVQVGAFSMAENASRLQDELRNRDEPAYVEREGRLHKVRVGPFVSRIDAIEARERLDAAGYSTLLLTLD